MLYSLQEQWDRNNVQKYSQSHSCFYYKTAETYQMAHIRMMKKTPVRQIKGTVFQW